MYKYAAILCLGLAACQSGGPSTSSILGNPSASAVSPAADVSYVVIAPNQTQASQISAARRTADITHFIAKGNASPVVIGAGDVLDIAIVSTSESGFIDFSQSSVSPISSTQLPAQTVASDGNVNVPPIGRVRAAGQSVQQFERFLTRRLGEVLVEPSVIVNLTDRRSASVSVLGDVASPGRYSIDQNAQHLVDVIASAGGPTERAEDLNVLMTRQGQSGEVSLRDLYANPAYNVHMKPGDIVSLDTHERQFTFLGAGGSNDTVTFNKPSITLAEALGTSGGLLNRRADRKGVFIYRNEMKSVVSNAGIDTAGITAMTVPTVYQFDMSQPEMLFVAGDFDMADGDIIYVSDSIVENINAIFSAGTAVVPAPVEFVRDATFN